MTIRSTMNRALLFGAIALLAAACGDSSQLPTETDSSVEQVQTLGGDDAAALVIHDRNTPDLMKIQGVVGTGLAVEDGKPRIRVYTVHGNVRGIPDHVENVPIERVVTGLIVAGDINNPASKERPAPNGFSIGHPDITAGTFGALVRGSGDVCYALSNNHVLANSNNAAIGDNALQPGPYDGGQNPADAIGTLADFEPISFSSNNTMDAAIARLFDAADATGATPSYGAPGTLAVDASVGMNVQKFGRTTGHTTGQVAETNVTVSVCYVTRGPFNCASAATFTGQFTITPGSFSSGGDSGSLIVTNSSNKNPVGLLFAGSSTRTIANPIKPVFEEFGVGIETNPDDCSNSDDDGGGDPQNLPPTADFTASANGLTVTFTDESTDSDGTVDGWSWDFGDNSTSTEENPTHTYGADGTYTVTLTVTDDDGATDSDSQGVAVDDETDSPGDFTLSVSAYKVRGVQNADLTWTGTVSSQVDIVRDGSTVATTANDGAFTDNIGNRGGGSYTYQVCEAGTSTCSNEATASF